MPLNVQQLIRFRCINSSIYLIDHAWTYRPQLAERQLRSHPGLLERMAALFDIDTEGMDKDDLIEQVINEAR